MDKLKLKYLQLIATFMIALVVTIPVYSANVFAGISNVVAKGSGGVNNYIGEDDYVIFEATASISGDAKIDADQVWLGENFRFDECEAGVDGYECTLRYPSEGNVNFDPRALPYTVILKDDDGDEVDRESDTLYVDIFAPEISLFSVEPETISSGDVEFKYIIRDKACGDASCEGKCSGIKKLELYKLDGTYEETVEIGSAGCSHSGEFLKDSLLFDNGRHTVYARAYDMLGSVSDEVSATFAVDNLPPQIDPNSFKITDETGLDMGYASPQPQDVIVYVEILSYDLVIDNIRGDFTSINTGYGNLKADCSEKEEGVYKCEWPIKFSLQEETTKEFIIKAEDLAGNKEEVSLAKSFGVDNIGPEVNSIKTDKVEDGKSYGKLEDNIFIAEIKEDGVGLNPKQVLLYAGNNVIKATNCTLGWACYWYGVELPGEGAVTVSIKDDTTDRLGNKASAFSVEVIVDKTKPKLINISVNSIIDTAIGGYFKTGDKLQISAVVEDEAIKTAYADLSSIIEDAGKVIANDCIGIGDNKWHCVWTTSSIDISGYIENFIYLNFEDVAGNVLQHKEAVTVYDVDDASPNYWSNEVKCSPKLVDRQTTSLINQKVFCHVELKPLTGDVTPLSIELGECSDDTTAVQEVELFNNQLGSKDPYLRFILKKSKFDVNEVNLNCPLSIITKAGNKITSTAEEENVEVKLEFYNMPLGELSESIQKQIDEAVEDATSGLMKLIGWLKKIAFYAKRICQILNIYYTVVGTLQTITATLGITENAGGPYTKATFFNARVRMCEATEEMKEQADNSKRFGDKFCKFVNCEPGFDFDGKYTSILTKWQTGGNKLITSGTKWMGPLSTESIEKWTGKNPASYMNPKDSIVVALLTACIPGIIHGLEKYRQIQCMYANCMQEGVGQQGLPVTACKDQKGYAECKYVTGEIFNAIPFTALFDYYMGMIKDVLSNPFKIIGAGLALLCRNFCSNPSSETPHNLCVVPKLLSLIGNSAQQVTSIIDQGVFTIREDYCEKLDIGEEGEDDEDRGGLF